MGTKTRVPAVEGWFTLDDDRPALVGTRCRSCGSYFFPRETSFCRNPACTGRELDDVELSRRGTVWSFTRNCFQPPPPYVAAEPFEPYALAAVHLEREQLVVLGQVEAGVPFEVLHAGLEVELVLGTLFEDDENEYLAWRWRPAGDGEVA